MRRDPTISAAEARIVEPLLAAYSSHWVQISLFKDQLLAALATAPKLAPLIHSIRSRLKDAGQLRDKPCRKIRKSREQKTTFDIRPDNLLVKVNDLVGVRILHLYTRQIRQIDSALREIFAESQYELLEGPFARTWDDESRQFFQVCKISTRDSPSLYTSVHYVIGSASGTKVTAEIQVRTLMEEVWGEVDHAMNYPQKAESLACREQLKVLARVTPSATRLVDSIFLTLEDYQQQRERAPEQPQKSQRRARGHPIAPGAAPRRPANR